MSASPARRLALRVVSRVRARNSWVHEVFASAVADTALDPRESALATRLAYGTVEMWGVLDEILDQYLIHPSAVEPRVKDALRIAAYEILFLKTPKHAAVHEGVELVKSVSRRATGLANAVLRRVAGDAASFPFGDPKIDLAALARVSGHPLWLAERLVADLGRNKAELLMRAGMSPAPLYVAHNPFAGSYEMFESELRHAGAIPEPFGPEGCFQCLAPAAAVRSRALAEGRGIVADAAAQAAVALTPVRPGMRVLDVAAGRGSKTVLLQAAAMRAGGPADILAIDVHRFKVEVLRDRMRALNVPGVTATVVDASDLDALRQAVGPSVDIVFVDAPCTGVGTLRRHPEKRWRLRPGDVEDLAFLGAAILRACAALVCRGGFVVYSTCTVFPSENEDVVLGFIDSEQGKDFEIVDVRKRVASQMARFVTAEGWFQSISETGGPDGHFAAVLHRK